MSLYLAAGPDLLSQLKDVFFRALESLGPRRKVLAVPPDITRFHSRAGELTCLAREFYGDRLTNVLPALGTHLPMAPAELDAMYPGIPHSLFSVHDWRNGLITRGEVPCRFIHEQSEGKLDFSWPVQLDRLLVEGGFDLILSIGQVVPHEVAGVAGYNKNILIGTGGADSINRSHYLSAVYGMERLMGRADNPVRRVLNYASDRFLSDLPIVYVLTVVSGGELRGLFIGDDVECFQKAADLSMDVNFTRLDEPIRKAVVYLDPAEFKSTWLGNKAIYRTRLAMADGGELVILAPGVRQFGEDRAIDGLIRKYGYKGTPATLRAVETNVDLAENLSAAAHLIHGSSEGRFTITYCPGHLGKEEVEAAGFRYAPLDAMINRYGPERLADGYQTAAGEEIYFISNPALGLWAHAARFSAGRKEADPCQLIPNR